MNTKLQSYIDYKDNIIKEALLKKQSKNDITFNPQKIKIDNMRYGSNTDYNFNPNEIKIDLDIDAGANKTKVKVSNPIEKTETLSSGEENEKKNTPTKEPNLKDNSIKSKKLNSIQKQKLKLIINYIQEHPDIALENKEIIQEKIREIIKAI